jgi:hypothetical protein
LALLARLALLLPGLLLPAALLLLSWLLLTRILLAWILLAGIALVLLALVRRLRIVWHVQWFLPWLPALPTNVATAELFHGSEPAEKVGYSLDCRSWKADFEPRRAVAATGSHC